MFLFVEFFRCPYVAINVSVQYNDGLLSDIILWTQCHYHNRRIRLNAVKRFCLCSLLSHLSLLIIFRMGCSEGLDAFAFFLKKRLL